MYPNTSKIDRAFSGYEAISFLEEMMSKKLPPYSYIFIDYDMPLLNGLDAIKQIQ